jgi:hypothetical protein
MDFELLMEQVAKAEGERLMAENERLKADPSATVPEEVSRRMLALIDGHFLEI